MHANSWSSHARMLAASPATTSSLPHISGPEVGGGLIALLVVVLLFRLTRKHNITIVNHHPAPVAASQGRGGGGHGLAKGLLVIGVALGGLLGVTTLMSHHPATTATATVPAVHPTVSATPAPTQSGTTVVPKVITHYLNAHPLLSGPQIVILVGILALAAICVTAIVVNRLIGNRGE